MKIRRTIKVWFRQIYNLRQNKILAWVIGPLLLAIGPALNFVVSYKLLKIFLALWPSLGIAFWKTICAYIEPTLQTDDLEILLESLDQPVKKKKDRFLDELEKFQNNRRKDYAKIFKAITRPEKQIELLMLGLYSVFREYVRRKLPDAKIWVVLFEFCGNKLSYLSYYKDRPCSKEEELLDKQSCVRRAKDQNRIVVVENIKKEFQKPPENRYFKKTSSGRDYGSIICFPIYDSRLKDAALVISIYCDEPGMFVPEKEKIYNQILEKFADRLLIEYSLLNLKEGGCHERKKT